MAHTFTRATAVAVLTLATLGVSSAATAVSWYSQSAPLLALENKVAQAGGYGSMYIENFTYARNSSYQKDYRAGGDAVYVDTDFRYWLPSVTGTLGFQGVSSKETDRTTSSSWIYDYRRHSLHNGSDRLRIVTHVCEDQSWSGDPCSANALATFDY